MRKQKAAAPPRSPEEEAQHQAHQVALRVVFFTVFLDILGFGIIIPQLAVYAAQFGATPALAGFLASTYSLMGFLFTPFWGRLSDRIGRRPVLLYSIFGTGLGYIIFAAASSLPWLFAARVIDGITGANISTAQAYVSDVTREEDRAKTFGIFGAIFGIGFALGPLIGFWLSHLPGAWGGNLGLGTFSAVLSFLNWALALKFLPETVSAATREANQKAHAEGGRIYFNLRGFERALSMANLNVVIVIGFLATTAFATMQGSYGIFVLKEYARPAVQKEIARDPEAAVARARQLQSSEHVSHAPTPSAGEGEGFEAPDADPTQPYAASLGGDYSGPGTADPEGFTWRHVEKLLVRPEAQRMVGSLFTVIGLLSLVVQGGLVRPLQKSVGQVNMVLAGNLLMAAGLTLIPLPGPDHFWGQYVTAIVLTLGNGLSTPVLTALASQFAPEQERGELLGVYQSTQSLGRIIGPNLGGLLFGSLSAGAPFIAGGLIMLSSFFLAFKLRGAVERHAQSQVVTA